MANFTQADLDLLRRKGIDDSMPSDDNFQSFSSGNPDKDQLLKGVLQANRPNESALLNVMNAYSPKEAPAPLAEPLDLSNKPKDEVSPDAAPAGIIAGATKGTEPEKDPATYNPQMRKGSGAALGGAIGTEVGQGEIPAGSSRQPADDSAPANSPPVDQAKPLSPLGLGTVDFGKSDLVSQENLQNAQDSKNYSNLLSNLGKSADIAGQGISGAKIHENPVWDSIASHAGDVVSDYANKIALQKQDPNSSYSKGFKDYLKQMGLDIKGDISADQAEKLMPEVFKHYEAQMAQNLKRELGQSALQAKKEEKDTQREFLSTQNDLNRDTKKDLARMMQDSKRDVASDKSDKDDKKMQEKSAQEARQSISGSRQRPDVRQAELDSYNIGKAKKLFHGDLNNLSKQQISLLVSEVAKIAKGGVPDAQEYRALSPNSYVGQLASFGSKLLNEPTKQNAGAFLHQYKNYIEDLDTNAKNVIAKHIGSQLRTRREAMGEKNYRNLAKENLDVLGDNFLKDAEDQEDTRKPQSSAPNDSNTFTNDPNVQKYAEDHFKGDYNQALQFLTEHRGYGK